MFAPGPPEMPERPGRGGMTGQATGKIQNVLAVRVRRSYIESDGSRIKSHELLKF
jgi:hypothetical protein